MSTQLESGHWTEDGSRLLSHPLLNFFARRRIAISLLGFTSLVSLNIFVRGSTPLHPFAWQQWPAASAFALLVFGIGLRSWAAGNLDKSRSVTSTGPYALTRNPMYIGSFCMMASFCLITGDLATGLFIAGPLGILYRMQVDFEEKRLLFLFPNDWPPYARDVPRFIPQRWSSEALTGWSLARWRSNREYTALAASALGVCLVAVWHFVVLNWNA